MANPAHENTLRQAFQAADAADMMSDFDLSGIACFSEPFNDFQLALLELPILVFPVRCEVADNLAINT